MRTDHMHIDDVSDAHEHDNQHLLEQPLKANGRGQLLVHDSTHDTSHVVKHHQYNQRSHKAIHTSNEIAEPATKGSYGNLDLRPDQINGKVTHFHILLKGLLAKPPL